MKAACRSPKAWTCPGPTRCASARSMRGAPAPAMSRAAGRTPRPRASSASRPMRASARRRRHAAGHAVAPAPASRPSRRRPRPCSLFSAMLANFMERELLVEQLRSANVRLLSYALSDPLTGLPNRRAIYEELERLQGRALREGGSILVGVIDLTASSPSTMSMGTRTATSSCRKWAPAGRVSARLRHAGPAGRRRVRADRRGRPWRAATPVPSATRSCAARPKRPRARWRTARPRPRSATSSWVRSRCPTTAPASAWWRWIRAA